MPAVAQTVVLSEEEEADRLINIKEVEKLVGLKKSWIHNRIKEGQFPAPARLSPRCSRWHLNSVRTWIESQG